MVGRRAMVGVCSLREQPKLVAVPVRHRDRQAQPGHASGFRGCAPLVRPEGQVPLLHLHAGVRPRLRQPLLRPRLSEGNAPSPDHAVRIGCLPVLGSHEAAARSRRGRRGRNCQGGQARQGGGSHAGDGRSSRNRRPRGRLSGARRSLPTCPRCRTEDLVLIASHRGQSRLTLERHGGEAQEQARGL
ncbi:hypothetical protein BMS3Bbin01_00182 [bacterium BMS3Bbin01]|nr:hypothetical protein BMS3Bbin01_00182 [bacterium BMS3Bbin01]